MLILVLILMWWISTEQVLLQLDDTHWSERLLQRLESEHKRSFACVYIVKYHQHAQWASTYQGSRVTITISITGWQLELGPAGKLCSDSLELYNVVKIMCSSRCDLCLGHNVQCPLIRFQAKLMYCIFPLRRQLCTLEEEKWVVRLNLKLYVVYIIVYSWEPCVRNCCRKGGKGHNHSSCFDIMSREKCGWKQLNL